jgi:hypothetical protein
MARWSYLLEGVIHGGEFEAKQISGNNWRSAPVYGIAILFGRCVEEMLPWSPPENIGRLF